MHSIQKALLFSALLLSANPLSVTFAKEESADAKVTTETKPEAADIKTEATDKKTEAVDTKTEAKDDSSASKIVADNATPSEENASPPPSTTDEPSMEPGLGTTEETGDDVKIDTPKEAKKGVAKKKKKSKWRKKLIGRGKHKKLSEIDACKKNSITTAENTQTNIWKQQGSDSSATFNSNEPSTACAQNLCAQPKVETLTENVSASPCENKCSA